MKKSVILTIIIALIISASYSLAAPKNSPDSKKKVSGNEGMNKNASDNYIFTGSFVHNISLDVPPGTHGMQPDVSLLYNSSGANGWCGMGWDLSFGSIQRSTKNAIPEYNNHDTFVYLSKGAMQELQDIGGNQYRLKTSDSFMKFKYVDTHNNPNQWQVWDKSGIKYIFGARPNSTINKDHNDTFAWYLSNVIDPNGNEIYFDYVADTNTANNQIYPVSIEYTHYGNDNAPLRQVIFNLTARSDSYSNDRAGFTIKTTKLLSSIETKVAGQPVRIYEFGYSQSPDTGKSLLSYIKQTSYANNSLPETTFTYQSNILQNPQDFLRAPEPWTHAPTDYGFMFYDFNNDSKMDIADYISGKKGLKVSYSNGAGFPNFVTLISLADCPENSDFYFGDFNRDNLIDIAQVYLTYRQHGQMPIETQHIDLWLNGPNGISNSNIVKYEENVQLSTPASSFIVADFNGDHKTEMIRKVSGGFDIFRIKDSGDKIISDKWSCSAGAVLSDCFFYDFNNDGKNDLATHVSGNDGLHVWFADDQHTSFVDQGVWLVPLSQGVYITRGDSVFGDFNGDGLVDVAIPEINHPPFSTPEFRIGVYINKGNKFEGENNNTYWFRTTAITSLLSLNRMFLADFNGDSLVDVAMNDSRSSGGYGGLHVWFNTGSGYNYKGLWTAEGTGLHNFILADFDGDGRTDVSNYIDENGASATGLKVFINNGMTPDLLALVTGSLGGKTSVSYKSSSSYVNRYLPFPIQVVSSIAVNDGLATSYATHDLVTYYEYQDGFYDQTNKEFLGFGQVKTLDAEGNYISTKFLQDQKFDDIAITGDGVNTFIEGTGPENWESNPYKGKAYAVLSYNNSNDLKAKTTSNYHCVVPTSARDCYFTYTTQTDNFSYDNTSKHVLSTFNYDNTYGNLIESDLLGDISDPKDDVKIFTEYAPNDDNDHYLVNYPWHTYTLNSTNFKVAEIWYYCDGLGLNAPPIKGNVTKVEKWLDTGPENPKINMTYDQYGNIITSTDANTNTTNTTYDDQYHTFPKIITNALGQTQNFTYDPKFGNVLTATDANNQITTYSYDDFGRIQNMWRPIDTQDSPAVYYTYIDTPIPTCTIISRKITERTSTSEPEYIKTYQFYDGLGRVAQTQSYVATSWGDYIIGDIKIYNNRGQVQYAYLPFFADKKSYPDWVDGTFYPYDPNSYRSHFAYDALGRLIEQRNADGSLQSSNFNGWTTTNVDANLHSTDYTKDAFGRIVEVDEHNAGVIYVTTYEYNTLGNLTAINRDKGGRINIGYDTLGRKTSMNDPQMGPGTWAYGYDKNGNLTSQTDAKLKPTILSYDALNRIITKTYMGGKNVTYHYDNDPDGANNNFTIGRLVKVIDLSGSTKFYYDELGRVTSTGKVIQGDKKDRTYITSVQYNTLGQIAQTTYPDDSVINYGYNNAGNLLRISDDAGKDYVSSMLYDGNKQLLAMDYGNGMTTAYQYDSTNLRLTDLITGKTSDFVFTDPTFIVKNRKDLIAFREFVGEEVSHEK
ncbi:MAG: SpvB/TcaC N-terminal domain-containing protein [Planctomycetota bacterium]